MEKKSSSYKFKVGDIVSIRYTARKWSVPVTCLSLDSLIGVITHCSKNTPAWGRYAVIICGGENTCHEDELTLLELTDFEKALYGV